MKLLEKKLAELSSYIPQADYVNPKVSGWSIGQQIEHSLNVLEVAVKVVKESDPKDFKSSSNLYKMILLPLGYFPRGKVKAPRAVRPKEEWSAPSLESQVKRVKEALSDYQNLDKNAHFTHPIFKHLNKRESLRFMNVHTEHHLKIIRDMLK